MRALPLALLLSFGSCLGLAQSSPASTAYSPGNPQGVLAAAAPHYDFSSPSLKPWHLKATYQLYDEKGKPSEQGTFEYWWASPAVYRATWTRGGQHHTDWHTADGKEPYEDTGLELSYFEYQLRSDFISPLPRPADYDPDKTYFVQEKEKFGKVKEPCFMIVPKMPQHGQLLQVPMGLFPSYCFDEKLPVLLAKWSFGALDVNFGSLVEFQSLLYLPRTITVFEGERKILTAAVTAILNLSPTDPSLTPPASARTYDQGPATIASDVMAGHRISGPMPIYPEDAKRAGAQGDATLRALIGRDGRIHDMQVITAPWPSLVASAMWAVSQWKYTPYLLNGAPVEVSTTIHVIYKLGN